MWTLLLTAALAADCPPLVELPAAVASTRTWPDRLALATCTERPEDEQARAEAIADLLQRLQEHHASVERGPLRELVMAAGSTSSPWVEQAKRAARLGRSLPERIDGSSWYDAVPVPAPEGATLSIGPGTDPQAAEALRAVATSAGWTVDDAGPQLTMEVVGTPEPAVWGKQLGYAVEANGQAGSRTVSVDGFAQGPMSDDTQRAMLISAAAQVLADSEVALALAPEVLAGPSPTTGALERSTGSELCLFRRPDNAGLPVILKVGPAHEVPVPTASHGCIGLPTGMSIHSPYGARVVSEGRVLIELSDKGEDRGRFRLIDVDADYVDKQLHKEKVRPFEPIPRPHTP